MKIKICLLGDPAVGKTSLIQKYIYNFFGDTYMRTLGTKVSRKIVKFYDPNLDSEFELTLMIWDIMGQKFSSMPLDKYLKLAQGALIVCDITRKDTFSSLAEWKKTLFNENGKIPVVCLANKIDLEKSAAIKISEFEQFSAGENVGHYVTSAKTGKNVNDAFLTLGKLIVNSIISKDSGKSLAGKTEKDTKTEPETKSVAQHAPIQPAAPISTNAVGVSSEEIDIKPGLGYIIKEERPDRSFKIFSHLIKKDIRGLCITRTHPDRIRDEFDLNDIPILWLSADSQKNENIVVPTFLPQLNTLIIDFIQKYNDVVILLEGIEYLIDQNDFKAVLSLIHSLNDYIMGSNARLIIPLDPLILEERQLHMLTRDFKIL